MICELEAALIVTEHIRHMIRFCEVCKALSLTESHSVIQLDVFAFAGAERP